MVSLLNMNIFRTQKNIFYPSSAVMFIPELPRD